PLPHDHGTPQRSAARHRDLVHRARGPLLPGRRARRADRLGSEPPHEPPRDRPGGRARFRRERPGRGHGRRQRAARRRARPLGAQVRLGRTRGMVRRSFGTTVGLRRAAAIIFALVAVLPMLAVLPVLHTAGVLASPYAQVTLLLAVGLAILGFFVLRRPTDEVARLAEGFANPTPTTAVPAATVPGLGRVTEIGQIGDALTHMLDDLRTSTERLEDLVFKLSTLNEVVELAARIPQMQDLLALVLERTMRTVRASIGSIMLLDHERQVLRVVVARGLPDDVVEHAEVAVGEGIPGEVVQLGEPVLVGDPR